MIEESWKALGPFPILQVFFGFVVLGVGTFVVIKGIGNKGRSDVIQLEDKRQEWEAYEHLRSIDEGIQQIVRHQGLTLEHIRMVGEIMRQQTEQLKALSAAIWNRGV